jgi:hypothetical protein
MPHIALYADPYTYTAKQTYTGELDIYKANAAILVQQAGVSMPPPTPVTFNGINTEMHPAVVLQPSWAPIVADVKVRGAKADPAHSCIMKSWVFSSVIALVAEPEHRWPAA